ncbi:hypothetical protein CsatB_014337 [Cannabis sativa]
MPMDPRVERQLEKLTRTMLWMSQRLGPDIRLPTEEELFTMPMPPTQTFKPQMSEVAWDFSISSSTAESYSIYVFFVITSANVLVSLVVLANVAAASKLYATDTVNAADSTNATTIIADATTIIADAATTFDAKHTDAATTFHAVHTTDAAALHAANVTDATTEATGALDAFDAADCAYSACVTFAPDAFYATNTIYAADAFDAIDATYATGVSCAAVITDDISAANSTHAAAVLPANARSVAATLLSTNVTYSTTTVWREWR